MFRFTTFLCAIILLVGCETKAPSHTTSHASIIRYAKTLEILEQEHSTEIKIIHPENKTVKSYILSKTKPSGLKEHQQWIKTPVSSIIALSGTHIGMLSVLDAVDKIKGISNQKYIYNKDVLKRLRENKLIDFGSEESISFESIVQSRAELLIFSGFGNDFPHTDQLRRAGTLCIPNYDWKEVHPLGKAEWVLFFGYLTGKEKEAKAYFSTIEKKYNSLKAKMAKVQNKPTVFSGNLYGDIWFTPAGESFNATLLSDAGGNYTYKNTQGTGSLEYSLEKVYAENAQTKFWINPGFSTLNELLSANPKADHFDAYKQKGIYCYSPNMNYFWEMSAIEPHFVLADLIRIFHPELSSDKLHYYERLD